MCERGKWSINDRSKWFHPDLTGKQAEALLKKKGRLCSFLVRKSISKADEFVLSVRQKASCIHIRIYNTEDYYDVFSGSKSSKFASWAELVDHYVARRGVLREMSGNTIELLFPVLYETEPLTDKWFHGALPREVADELLTANGKPFCFLVRNRLLDSSQYVLSFLCKNKGVEHLLIKCEDDKYSIVSSHTANQHSSITELVEFYKTNPIELASGEKCILGEPVLLLTECNYKPVRPVSKLPATTKQTYLEEYAELQSREAENLDKSRTEGQRPENKTKNRYKNILPYDETRVVLRDGDPSLVGSDYINANYISVIPGRKQYIASQGCTSHSVSDFWRMVWQENTHIIVMVTELVENGKNKCVQYWPKDTSETNYAVFGGRMVITMQHENCFAEHTIRQFTLSKEVEKPEGSGNYMAIGECRTVYHYHFTAWPDKSLPKRPESLTKFLLEILEKQAEIPSAGPVVVHCSAGIGRTGTFIVIGFIFDQVRQSRGARVNVKELVRKIREQRSGMVQTQAQYKYLYDVVDYLK